MTIRERMVKRLTDNGMFAQDAETVLNTVQSDDSMRSMSGRWDHDTAGYPGETMAAIWYAVKTTAAEWIEANAPQAWYRSQF